MHISKEQYVDTFNALPEPVRAFLVADDFGIKIQRIVQPYNLHVDTIGVLSESTSYMLMGLMSPSQVLGELATAGVDSDTAQKVLAEINEKVFKPIRQQLQDQGTVQTPAKPKPEQKVSKPVEQTLPPNNGPVPNRIPVPIYSPLPVSSTPSVPPTRVQPPPNLPGQMPEPPAPRPVPPTPHIEVPTPPAPVNVTEQPAPQSDQHARIMHTMARDMAALKSGADPLRVAHPAPPAWAEAPNKPAPVVPPPAPVVPPQPQASKPVQTVAPAELEAPQPQDALRTHLKQYGVDPYREPVE